MSLRSDVTYRLQFEGLEPGDLVLTPANMLATVETVSGPNAYDRVTVIDDDYDRVEWCQWQLIKKTRREYPPIDWNMTNGSSRDMGDGDTKTCGECGEPWPCSQVGRTDRSPLLSARHHIARG